MTGPTYGWNWRKFLGSHEALRWGHRDLASLDAIVARVPIRRAVIQAGGNLGLFPKRLAHFFPTVYTFEPAPKLFPLLVANAPEPNIIRYQAALGLQRQLVRMDQTRRDGKPNAHEGITHVAGAGTVPTLRIDDLALPRCDLIQLDLEGYEWWALQGAVETLERCRPVLAVEINKNCGYYGLEAAAIRAWILARGYSWADRLHSDDVFLPVECV
jgi:FkbM family methyltransferase